jgi:hypothetical protein
MLTEAGRPVDYAKIQFNMGCAYNELSDRFGGSHRGQAANCFREAYRVFSNLRMAADARKAKGAWQAASGEGGGGSSLLGRLAGLFK